MKDTLKRNGTRAFGLLVMLIAMLVLLLAPPAKAQTKFTMLPLGFGTVTNTTYITNIYTWSGALTTNYVTNVVVSPNFNPTNFPTTATGKTNILNWGATVGSPNPNASGAQSWSLVNGWLLLPPNAQIWQDTIISMAGATTNGQVYYGYDFSADAGYGTTNTPVRTLVNPVPSGTNEYITLLGNTSTNLTGEYIRWDYFSTDPAQACTVVTNRLFYRTISGF